MKITYEKSKSVKGFRQVNILTNGILFAKVWKEKKAWRASLVKGKTILTFPHKQKLLSLNEALKFITEIAEIPKERNNYNV